MTHPMAEFFPPTCLLCSHFVFCAAEKGYSSWTPGGPASMLCMKGHALDADEPRMLYRAASCPDFDLISADERDRLAAEAAR